MIVGFTGRMGSGKSTAATIAADILSAERVGFSQALKRDALGWVNHYRASVGLPGLTLAHLEVRKPTFRPLLQGLGTAVRDLVQPDYWINVLMDQLTEDTHWVIDDVRFPNEAEAIRDRDGVVILIRATDAVRKQRLGMQFREAEWQALQHHASEEAIDQIRPDAVLLGESSPPKLRRQLLRLLGTQESALVHADSTPTPTPEPARR